MINGHLTLTVLKRFACILPLNWAVFLFSLFIYEIYFVSLEVCGSRNQTINQNFIPRKCSRSNRNLVELYSELKIKVVPKFHKI